MNEIIVLIRQTSPFIVCFLTIAILNILPYAKTEDRKFSVSYPSRILLSVVVFYAITLGYAFYQAVIKKEENIFGVHLWIYIVSFLAGFFPKKIYRWLQTKFWNNLLKFIAKIMHKELDNFLKDDKENKEDINQDIKEG